MLFRGNIGVILFNHNVKPFKIKKGDRVAQLIFEKYLHDAKLIQDETINDITERGKKGFGSSGINDQKTIVIVLDDNEANQPIDLTCKNDK